MDPQKLNNLKQLIFEVTNSDKMSVKDFTAAFAKVIEFVKTIKTGNEKDRKAIDAALESCLSDVETKIATQSDSIQEELAKRCVSEMKKITTEMQTGLKKIEEIIPAPADLSSIETRLSSLENEEEAEIPTADEILKDLPKNGIAIRDGLEKLKGDDRLDIKAIRGVEELETKIDKKIASIPTGRGGGNGGLPRGATQYAKLAPNGVLTTFAVPKSTTAILFTSDFPNILFENNGFTINATRTQITITTDNPISNGAQLVYSYSPIFGKI